MAVGVPFVPNVAKLAEAADIISRPRLYEYLEKLQDACLYLPPRLRLIHGIILIWSSMRNCGGNTATRRGCKMKLFMSRTILLMAFVFPACPVFAGELSLLGGYTYTDTPLERTYAWQAQYMEGLGEHLAYSLSYLNQGHFISHHRDANAANLGLRTNLLDRHLSLGIGGGGLFYYDTIRPADGSSPRDFHGWGTMASFAAT